MSLKFTVDVGALTGLAERLGTLDAVEFGKMAVRTVNGAADATYEAVRPRMISSINLTDDYVTNRMEVRHAKSANNATAVIVAKGSGGDMTILARYGAQQLVKPVKYPNESFAAGAKGRNPKKPGASLSWKLRTGNATLGIPVGMKQAGVSVEVSRGVRKDIAGGFLMNLRNGNGWGLFTRDKGTLKMKHRYGPSVYQLFASTATRMQDEIADDLQARLIDEAEQVLLKALK
jgi:hypothetical protein